MLGKILAAGTAPTWKILMLTLDLEFDLGLLEFVLGLLEFDPGLLEFDLGLFDLSTFRPWTFRVRPWTLEFDLGLLDNWHF